MNLGFLLILFLIVKFNSGNEDAKRLFDDLMVNYNRHSRPANSATEPVVVQLKLRLSQIIDVVGLLGLNDKVGQIPIIS